MIEKSTKGTSAVGSTGERCSFCDEIVRGHYFTDVELPGQRFCSWTCLTITKDVRKMKPKSGTHTLRLVEKRRQTA